MIQLTNMQAGLIYGMFEHIIGEVRAEKEPYGKMNMLNRNMLAMMEEIMESMKQQGLKVEEGNTTS